MSNHIPTDHEAATEIGELYRNSAKTMIESINARLECGRRLNEVKAGLGRGELDVWFRSNRKALGFDRSTAFRLMRAAKVAPARQITDQGEALRLSRTLWGHEPSPKGRSVVPSRKPQPVPDEIAALPDGEMQFCHPCNGEPIPKLKITGRGIKEAFEDGRATFAEGDDDPVIAMRPYGLAA